MNKLILEDKILGGLIGAAAGDALGAATEARSREQIIEYFGGKVVDFVQPPQDTFSAGSKPGQVTDDFSSLYFLMEAIVNNKGIVTPRVVGDSLVEWSNHKVFFDRFAGPTTRAAINRFKKDDYTIKNDKKLSPRQATNGAAMRIGALGFLYPGDMDKTIDAVITVTRMTHDNYLAISGALAVALAVNQALQDNSNYIEVIKYGLYGAEIGEIKGREISKDVPGPSVLAKMKYALRIANDIKLNEEEKVIEITDRIGTGLMISEAVPAAFGIFATHKGDCMKTIISCVNAGYDTDTLATIAGIIAGSLNGSKVFPNHFLDVLDNANGFDIESLSQDILNISLGGN